MVFRLIMQAKPDVSTPSSEYQRMMPRWAMLSALLAGTEAMREAGETYLPRHENETERNYRNRLRTATLLNVTEQTLAAVAGKPFTSAMQLSADAPDAYLDLSEDIDGEGNSLHVFCRRWFKDAWAYGASYLYVDTTGTDNQPVWSVIPAQRVIAARVHRNEYVHVRIAETEIVADDTGFGERRIERIRVIEPGTWTLWEKDQRGNWSTVDEGRTGYTFVPLVPFFAGERLGTLEVKPPLLDLAYLNIEHWQSKSDQRNVLTVSRFPILAASGVPADADVTIGPNNFLAAEDPQGKWYYVEHSGAAIQAGAEDLKQLEDKMATYGAEFTRNKVSAHTPETATGRMLDASAILSTLQSSVEDFADAVELGLVYTALLSKQDPETAPTVVFASENLADSALTQVELNALLQLRANRDISRRAMIEEFRRRKILPDDFDPERDEGNLANELPAFGV